MKDRKRTRSSVISGSAASVSHTSAWHQPSGRPASFRISTKRRHDSGVVRAGLTMTGVPTATAGTVWCTIRFSGWLNALIAETTPIGSRCVNASRFADDAVCPIGICSPVIRGMCSMASLTPLMARRTSTVESTWGLPPSLVASRASSST